MSVQGKQALPCDLISWHHAFAAAAVVVLLLGVSAARGAIDPPIGTKLVGSWNEFAGSYADVWADGQYVYLGHFGHSSVDVIDISDPTNPVKVAEVIPSPSDQFASAQDVKVANGLLFVALESDGGNGVLVVDVRDPTNPVNRTVITTSNFSDVHNTFYADGYLYLANSRTSHVSVIDLTSYDPDNAPASITSALWTIVAGSSFVHDITVVNQRLYACAWNSGLWVYDVSDIANQAPVFLGSAPGSSTHSAWPTADGQFVVTGEERMNGGIKVFRITDNGGSVTLTQTDSLVLSSQAFSVHNQVVVGNRLYNSWYQAGLQVLDIDPVDGTLNFVARYDTFSGGGAGFNGAWGVYPFLGQDRVLVSDIASGLFVINVDGSASLALAEPLPDFAHPALSTRVTVQTFDSIQTVVPGSVVMHLEPGEAGQADVGMTLLGNGLYEGFLPPVPCGETVEFYFSADTDDSQTIVLPDGAPGQTFSLSSVSTVVRHIHHDFETQAGWTVGDVTDTATTGIWVRGDPIGTGAQPENDNPAGTGTQCFFTGQGSPGGSLGEADIDNGTTTLFSPVFDATVALEPYIGYARWYSNDQGAAPNQDQMDIFISNNGGGSWTLLESVTENAGVWVSKRFRVADVIAPTAAMQLKFIASDLPDPSVVEAALDDFVLEELVCSQIPGDSDGNGVVEPADHEGFDVCMTGPVGPPPVECTQFDFDSDGDVDMDDHLILHLGAAGPA